MLGSLVQTSRPILNGFGLGLTPDNPCYDTTRPKYDAIQNFFGLPYIYNTSNETACLQKADGGLVAGSASVIKQVLYPSAITSPTLDSSTYSPGLPTNYDSLSQTGSTGTIPSNPSGQTTIPTPYVINIPDPTASDPNATPSLSTMLMWLGIGLGGMFLISIMGKH